MPSRLICPRCVDQSCGVCSRLKKHRDNYRKRVGPHRPALTVDQTNAKRRAQRAANPERFRLQDKARDREKIRLRERAALPRRRIRRRTYRRSKVGHTEQYFTLQLELQQYMCAGCDKPILEEGTGKRAADHCHSTQKPRGVLCAGCNTLLGLIERNPAKLGRLLAYQEKWARIHSLDAVE